MSSITKNFDNIDGNSLLCKLVKEKDNVDFESEDYKKFVKERLLNIIDINTKNEKIGAYQIGFYYKKYFMNVIKERPNDIKYLLAFFKKYDLLLFYTLGRRIEWLWEKNKLIQEDIYIAYYKELAYVNGKVVDKEKQLKPSILEDLEEMNLVGNPLNNSNKLINSDEQYAEFLEQYVDFIIDRENGLYKVLTNALAKFDGKKFIIEYNPLEVNFKFMLKFFVDYEIWFIKFEINETLHKDYLPEMHVYEWKELGNNSVKYLFASYFNELQRIEYFVKSKEQLWEEYISFTMNNQEWVECKKARTYQRRY